MKIRGVLAMLLTGTLMLSMQIVHVKSSPATIWAEDFEGEFPGGSWACGDWNSGSGLDYWDDTSYNSHDGDWSGWCAQIGEQYDATVTVFTEDFEGDFPGSTWVVDDLNSGSGLDYWDDTSYNSHDGDWSGWCAQIGEQDGLANADVHNYDDDMEAYMYRSVSLGGYTSVSLSYWYWLESEQDYDYLKVMYFDGSFHYVDAHAGYSGGWQHSTVSIPTSAIYVGFYFISDNSVHDYEGAYVDDIALTATTTVPNDQAHNYDDDMEAYMYRSVSLGGYTSVSLSYWYWLESEQDYDYLKVMYYSGGSWNYLDAHAGYSGGWQHSTVSIPTSATQVGFYFYSDESNHVRQGAYVDDVTLSGAVADVPPTLSNGYVDPTSGVEELTIFSYYMHYYDPEGEAPTVQHVHIDDVLYEMSLYSGSPSDGVYRYQTKLSAGPHNYFFVFCDGVNPKIWLPTTGSYSGPPVSPNIPPILSNGDVNPDSGNELTTFSYYVTYYDPEGQAPSSTKHVWIDGVAHAMSFVPGSGSPASGVYRYETKLLVGSHNYYFEFGDGYSKTRLPTTSTYPGPTVSTPEWQIVIDNKADSKDYPTTATAGQPFSCTVDWAAKVPTGYAGFVDAILVDLDTSDWVDATTPDETAHLTGGTHSGSFTLGANAPTGKNTYRLQMQILLGDEQTGIIKAHDTYEWTVSIATVPYVFADGFESGSFNAWTGRSVSSGESASVATTRQHHGTRSARFASNGGSGTESAYCYKTTSSLSELYARGYFYVSRSGIVQSGDRFYFIALRAGSNVVAYAGWRKTSGVLKWTLLIKSGTTNVIAYSTSSPSLNRWYCVELRWKKDSVNGLGELWVDGVKVCAISSKNTAAYGDISQVRFGLPSIYYCGSTTVFCDCCTVSKTYNGPES